MKVKHSKKLEKWIVQGLFIHPSIMFKALYNPICLIQNESQPQKTKVIAAMSWKSKTF